MKLVPLLIILLFTTVPCFADQVVEKQAWEWPTEGSYIGLGIVDLSEPAAHKLGLIEPHGVEITSVVKGSPAQAAGLKVGDIVLAYRGDRIHGIENFARMVKETPIGREIMLDVMRAGTLLEVPVKIGKKDFEFAGKLQHCESCNVIASEIGRDLANGIDFAINIDLPRIRMSINNKMLGVELEEIDGQLAKYFGVESGVLVRSVASDSKAEQAGLRAGDVITSVDGKAVRKTRDVIRFWNDLGSSGSVVFDVMSERKSKLLEINNAHPGKH